MLLTIDLDIIMEPCINLYNSKINGLDRENIWRNNQKILDINRHLSINKSSWIWIKNLIKQAADKNIPYIVYSDNHNNVLTSLDFIFNQDKLALGQDLIVNIDHHHDLGYKNTINEFLHNNVSCANWVYYLLKTGYTSSYCWLHNSNSELPSLDENFNYVHYIFNEQTEINSLLKDCNIIVFISSSPWIPPQYNNYIINLQSILYNTFNNVLYFKDNNIIHPNTFNLFRKL